MTLQEIEKLEQSIHHDVAKVQCIFIHGWGMNSAVWQPFIGQLPDTIDAIRVDLAGHGERSATAFTSLDELTMDLVEQLESQIDGSAVWVAWSLGALPVLQIAHQRPDLVKKLCLVTANPCFVKQPGWLHGVDAAVFDSFAENLVMNTEKTLTRFLSLQVQGLRDTREILRDLKSSLVSKGLPTTEALKAGLDILKTTDLREWVSQLDMPQLWLLGERDTLVPASLAEYLATLDGVKSPIIRGSAHLPFISHTDQVIEQLVTFIHDPV